MALHATSSHDVVPKLYNCESLHSEQVVPSEESAIAVLLKSASTFHMFVPSTQRVLASEPQHEEISGLDRKRYA